MTLIEPDMNLRMPDISTTVETLNLISKMEAQKENIRTVIAPEHKHKYKDIENGLKGEEKVLIEQMGSIAKLLKLILKAQLKEIGLKVLCLRLTALRMT